MRCPEAIVKAPEKYGRFMVDGMLKNSEHFFIKRIFFDSVVIIKSCLRAPADVERARYVSFAPFHYLAKLIPIRYLLKFKMLDGRARDYHSVKAAMLYLIKGAVKREHMLGRSVGWLMSGGLKQFKLYLERRVSDKAGYLCFRNYLLRHQIEHKYVQGANILRNGAGFCHYEDVFVKQSLCCRKEIRYFYRHNASVLRRFP
jgi:hypothetical protein